MSTRDWCTQSGRRMLSAAALLILLVMAPAWAQESFRATHIVRLDGEGEVPTVETDGTGIAIIRVDTLAKRLEYRISVSDLVDVRAAHFHTGRADTTGPVIHTITLPANFATTHTVTGVWEDLTATDIMRLDRGNIYVNFHTGANPGGEIRGQVDRIPNLVANLDTLQETDPVKPSGGSGEVNIVLDPIGKRLEYVLTFQGLTGPAQAAHFHRGARGVAGEVAQAITLGGREGRAAGTWENISDADMALLLDRKIYVNVHTALNPAGEIRGQVFPIEFYTAAISPQNEVTKPSNSQASGTGFAFAASEIDVIADFAGEFIVGGTTGPVTAAHIHAGAIGVKGDIIQPLDSLSGTFWYVPDFSFVEGDSLARFRSTGTYVNFHTEQWPEGELRGQLIPAQANLVTSTSGVAEDEAVAGSLLSASVERSSGAISFHVGAGASGASRTIALYSSIGTRIAEIEVTGDRARMESRDLASGLYFAQLLVDRRPVGICRVMVAR